MENLVVKVKGFSAQNNVYNSCVKKCKFWTFTVTLWKILRYVKIAFHEFALFPKIGLITVVKSLRARSQILVVGVTGRAPGWPGALKLPGTAV